VREYVIIALLTFATAFWAAVILDREVQMGGMDFRRAASSVSVVMFLVWLFWAAIIAAAIGGALGWW